MPKTEFPNLTWQDPVTDLQTLLNLSLDLAEKETAWYAIYRRLHGSTMRFLRIAAILFFAFGGIWPVVRSFNAMKDQEITWGYLALALAGIFTLFDKYLGISTGFLRFYTAELQLIKLRDGLVYDWNLDKPKDKQPLTATQIDKLINLLKTFQQEIAAVIDKETSAWAAEFKTEISDLQAMLDKSKAGQARNSKQRQH